MSCESVTPIFDSDQNVFCSKVDFWTVYAIEINSYFGFSHFYFSFATTAVRMSRRKHRHQFGQPCLLSASLRGKVCNRKSPQNDAENRFRLLAPVCDRVCLGHNALSRAPGALVYSATTVTDVRRDASVRRDGGALWRGGERGSMEKRGSVNTPRIINLQLDVWHAHPRCGTFTRPHNNHLYLPYR